MPLSPKYQIETKKVELPSTADKPEGERLWVVVKDKLFFADLGPILDGNTETAKKMGGVASMIVDWNFTDPEGNTEPITPDNVQDNILGVDIMHLVEIYDQLFDETTKPLEPEQKKTSGSTLTPSTPTQTETQALPSQ